MKKIITFVLAIMMVFTLAACGNKTDPPTSGGGTTAPGTSQQGQTDKDANKGTLVSKIGDTASFGSYNSKPIEWLCLAVEDNKALLITKDCVSLDIFNEPMSDGSQVVWADCTLRAWLNGEFLKNLSVEEQALLFETEHASNDNLGFVDYPAEEVEWKSCTDKVFLLSAEEVQTYFSDDESRIAKISLSDAEEKATIARYKKLFNYEESTSMGMIEEMVQDNGAVEYWLRTNGRGYMVQTVDYDGRYSDYGSNQDTTFKGVRPAAWVSLAND